MRFAGIVAAIALMALSGQSVAEEAKFQGYSEAYGKCMNSTHGDPNKTQRCIKNELKLQNKQLKKNYKMYQKTNLQSQSDVKQQHGFWLQKVKQQCPLSVKSQQGELQQSQCALNMVISQSNLYAARSLYRKS